MVRRVSLLALLVAGCAHRAAPPPPVATAVAPVDAGAAPAPLASIPPPPDPLAGVGTVTVMASRAASRQPESPRLLRRLVAKRGGRVEIPAGYPRVSLVVSAALSGTLDDPDYARRPVGVNHLPVVLLDEAAYAAPTGRWSASGELTASGVLQARDVGPFLVALGRDAGGLLVGYQDVARYPYTIVTRRFDPAALPKVLR